MRVLIGCAASGIVREAFRRRGFDAWECDLRPSEDGGPHIVGDVLDVIASQHWDVLIAHPPCTYLAGSGLHWNKRRPGRAKQTEAALAFVRALWSAPVKHIAIENPVGCIGTRIAPPSQSIQPYEFGDDASKRTCLWLRNLPRLRPAPSARFAGRMVEWPRGSGRMVERWGNQTDSGQNKEPPSETRWIERSRTYPGIAEAMAEQWGRFLTGYERRAA